VVVDALQGLWSQAGFGGRDFPPQAAGALVRGRGISSTGHTCSHSCSYCMSKEIESTPLPEVSQFQFDQRGRIAGLWHTRLLATRRRDPVQLAKQCSTLPSAQLRTPLANQSPQNRKGRAGGLKGGESRAAKLTSIRRSEIARKAAKACWNRNP